MLPTAQVNDVIGEAPSAPLSQNLLKPHNGEAVHTLAVLILVATPAMAIAARQLQQHC